MKHSTFLFLVSLLLCSSQAQSHEEKNAGRQLRYQPVPGDGSTEYATDYYYEGYTTTTTTEEYVTYEEYYYEYGYEYTEYSGTNQVTTNVVETVPQSPPPSPPPRSPQPVIPVDGDPEPVSTATTVPDEPEPIPTEPATTEPEFPVDFSTVESSLRTSIFQGDVEGAAEVLNSPRVISLGAGLTYPVELSPLVEPSSNRNEDPDVVAFKALAKSALDTNEAIKLATAVVFSFQPDCECSAWSADEADDIRLAFAQDFRNRTELQEILDADANTEFVPPDRRLSQAGKSPVSSFVCASCWPRRKCRKCHWC